MTFEYQRESYERFARRVSYSLPKSKVKKCKRKRGFRGFNALLRERTGTLMKYTESLKKNFQFRFVYNKGKSLANRYLVIYIIRNTLDGNRLGISVSKKVGNSVVRSRVTRLIKESYRLKEEDFQLGWDIVVIARSTAKDTEYNEISKALYHLMKKHGLMKA